MDIDIKPDLIANEAQKIKRKGWGQQQSSSPIRNSNNQHPESEEKSPRPGRKMVPAAGGFRMQRTPELQTSSTDPILALLNKSEETKQDMPLQIR